MNRRTALHIFGLGITTLVGACGTGTIAVESDPPTPPIVPPEPIVYPVIPGGLVMTNSSAGASAANGLSVRAGSSRVAVGMIDFTCHLDLLEIDEITATFVGSASPSDVSTFELMSGTESLAFGQMNGKRVTFSFPRTPLRLTYGQNVTVRFYATIGGGINRYFQLAINAETDVLAFEVTGEVRTARRLPTVNVGSFPIPLSRININTGGLLIQESPDFADHTVGSGGTSQRIGWFELNAFGEAVRITSIALTVTFGNGLRPEHVSSLRLRSIPGGANGFLEASVSSLGLINSVISLTNQNYIVPANQSCAVYIEASFVPGAVGTIHVSLSGTYAQGFISLASISVPATRGRTMTVQ